MIIDSTDITILVVDDNDADLRLYQRGLREFRIITARDFSEAMSRLEQHGLPNLMIVDLYMPGRNGLELGALVRSISNIPIVMATTETSADIAVEALDRFAIDFIEKPIVPTVLAAKLRRIVADMCYPIDRGVVTVDARLQVNFSHQTVIADGQEINLTPKEAKVLNILMRDPNRCIPKQQILTRAWDINNETSQRSLKVIINRLRQKIETNPKKPRYITTEVTGTISGYRFNFHQNI